MSSARALALSLAALAPLCAQNERPPEAFSLAVGLQQRGLHEEAARQFEAFLQQAPTHALAAEAHYRLGLARLELGKAERAIEALQAALQRAASGWALRPECRYRLGNLLEAQRQHAAALGQFDALVAEVGKDHYLYAAACYAAGEAHRELGDDGKAAVAFAAAAEAATGERANFRFPALYQLGFAQSRQQDHAAAAATFATAATAAGDDAAKGECFYLSGDALLRLQEYDAAARAFRRVVERGGDFADDASLGLGFVASGRGDAKAAAAAFGELLQRWPDSPLAATARLERGRALYQAQDAATAATVLQPLLADGVAAAVQQQARELLGLCALATGQSDTAIAALQAARDAAAPAERARLSFALGEALADAGKWAEAVAAYDAVGADAPPALRGDAAYGACFALHALGRHADSTARAERVLALDPPHRLAAEARLAIAENHFAARQYEAAEAAYAQVADAPALRPAARWKLAWCRYLRGDHAAAAQRFGEVAADTASPHAEEALAMQALATLEAGDAGGALGLADQYLARHRDGAFVARTERVAARVLRQRGDLAAAQQRLQRAAAAAAAGPDGGDQAAAAADRAEQAELSYQQGDFRGADAAFAALAGRDDALGARSLAGRAWCAFELGDDAACAAALAAAKAHAAAAAELPGLLELESALAHRRQDWPAAIAAASTFLQRFAGHAKAPALQYALGVAQARGGDDQAARATLSALAAADRYRPAERVHYELAWACRRSGDEAAALAAFERVVAVAGADADLAGEARLHLGVAALAAKDLAAATRWLEPVAGRHRGRAWYRLAFAQFEAAGDDKAALAAARERFVQVAALPGEELAGEARYLVAECCQRLGDARGAVAALQELLAAEPQHARADRARLLLGECAVVSGDAATAITALEPFVREQGRERAELARALLWLGKARLLGRDHAAAVSTLQRVTELSDGPVAAEAQFRIGEAREAQGDLRAAADAFVKLPILYAHAEWVQKGLLQAGLCYQRLQQPEKAQRFFKELVDKYPGTAEAKTASEHLRPN